jgi:hypothetical protein
MVDEVERLKHVYERFNARDMETVLAAMHEDVTWANGMEGGHVHGREGVRSYWTRQWTMFDPHVEPVGFSIGPDGEVVVEVHQIVRDLQGNVLADQMVGHIFRFENGLVNRFDIRGALGQSLAHWLSENETAAAAVVQERSWLAVLEPAEDLGNVGFFAIHQDTDAIDAAGDPENGVDGSDHQGDGERDLPGLGH